MKFLLACSLLLMSAAASFAVDIPRKAPDFTVTLPQGKTAKFSDYAGKVVAVEFLFTTCPHCQHASQIITKLQNEYGPKGFQAIGVAFNDMANMLVPDFIRDYKVGYPVGWSSREPINAFLQNNPDYALHVPQIVLIDRKGMIRVQSQHQGDAVTATEPNLRKNIEMLLAEPPPATARAKKKGSRKAS